NIEILGSLTPDNSLVLFWWSNSHDWQSINISEMTGKKILSNPDSWNVIDGDRNIEHFAAVDLDNDLIVFWDFEQSRKLLEQIKQPFAGIKPVRNKRQKLLVICWDPKRPDDPAPSISDIRSTMDNVRDYFLEISDGYFTIDVVD